MKAVVLTLLTLACTCVPASAQEGPKTATGGRLPRREATPDVPLTRFKVSGQVAVGESAPDFELTSSTGHDVALSRLRGDWVMLRFAKDRREFADLGSMSADLSRIGVRLMGICGDKPQTLRPFVQRVGIPFEILADVTGEISAVYGFYDYSTSSSRTGFVVVDRSGVVRLVLQGEAPADQIVALTRYTMTGFQARP